VIAGRRSAGVDRPARIVRGMTAYRDVPPQTAARPLGPGAARAARMSTTPARPARGPFAEPLTEPGARQWHQ
jgi:hypothetical protein